MKKLYLIQSERGAQLVEYAIAAAALLVVAIAAIYGLRDAGEDRANQAINVEKEVVPCSSGLLSGDQCY